MRLVTILFYAREFKEKDRERKREFKEKDRERKREFKEKERKRVSDRAINLWEAALMHACTVHAGQSCCREKNGGGRPRGASGPEHARRAAVPTATRTYG